MIIASSGVPAMGNAKALKILEIPPILKSNPHECIKVCVLWELGVGGCVCACNLEPGQPYMFTTERAAAYLFPQ